ncbi:hypothetical protein EK21DRAFT_112587 [Setomelanomma holmii]|uniref:Uncharacterized protein n=1 Tax=Setomelanomma holmii TaxID=210430 RepID=A0A9P4LJY0_9PLEO|nr:hypothetical protein EK21DRAFT_112587 [Setomelanomma holmii]
MAPKRTNNPQEGDNATTRRSSESPARSVTKLDTPLPRLTIADRVIPPKYKVRRILAERPTTGRVRKQRKAVTEFLVEWLPTWQLSTTLGKGKDSVEAEWRTLKTKRMTFDHEKVTYLHDDNLTENDNARQHRAMAEFLFKKVRQELGIRKDGSYADWDVEGGFPLKEIIKTAEWEFADADEAARAARLTGRNMNITAGMVLRRSLRYMRDGQDSRFVDIRVRYLGQVDSNIKSTTEGRPTRTTRQILQPMCDPIFKTLDPDNWEEEDVCKEDIAALVDLIWDLTENAPFVFANDWLMFFSRLFLASGDIGDLLQDSGVHLGENWQARTRDRFILKYRLANEDDDRTPHDIQETYLTLRDMIQDVHRGITGKEKIHPEYFLFEEKKGADV